MLTPEWLKEFAIRTFGEHDQGTLRVGMGITLGVVAAALGMIGRNRPRWAAGLMTLGIAVAGVLPPWILSTEQVLASRAAVKPPDPAGSQPAPEVGLNVPGLTQFLTANDAFYRVATAFTVRRMTANAKTMAVQPALERRWNDALASFDVRTWIGVHGRADTVEETSQLLRDRGVEPARWYGVWLLVDWLEFSGTKLDPSDSTQVAATAAVELEASSTHNRAFLSINSFFDHMHSTSHQ